MLHDQVAPNLVEVLGNMQVPPDGAEECALILIDFRNLESGYLAPGPRRVVAILEPLGGKNEGREEHAPTTLQGPTSVRLAGLLHGEVMGGNVRLDQDQIIESHLQGRVTRARAAQSLLDELPERQYTVEVGTAWHRRCRPDGFDDIRGRIWIGG